MKIAVTGHKGKLGSRLVNLGVLPIKADILYSKQLRRELDSIKPDVVIHAAGISSVAECEKDYDKAIAVNVHGSALVFEAAAYAIGEGRCVLLSSDQVFDGEQGEYKESDEPNPIHDYGRTKYGAEALAEIYDNKIVRLSRGVDIKEKDISEYLDRLKNGQEIYVPTFMYRSYAHLDFLASALLHYAALFESIPKTLHIGGTAQMSFYAFMKMVAKEFGFSSTLVLPRDRPESFSPRPYRCGFDVSLAESIGIPLFTPESTALQMRIEWTSKHPS